MGFLYKDYWPAGEVGNFLVGWEGVSSGQQEEHGRVVQGERENLPVCACLFFLCDATSGGHETLHYT